MLVVDKGQNGTVKVIHYTSSMQLSSSFELSTDTSFDNMVVKEEEVCIQRMEIERLEYSRDIDLYKPDKAIHRGRQKLGESKDDVCFSNAESFVNWLLTGKNLKEQEALGVNIALVIGGVVVGLGIIGLIQLLTGSKKKDDSE